MGPKPSSWGTGKNALPPSLTKGGQAPKPLQDTTGPGLGTRVGRDGRTPPSCSTTLVDPRDLPVRDPGDRLHLHRQRAQARHQATFYTLTSATNAAQDPKSWTLQGSTDGTHWKTLDTSGGQVFTDRLRPGRSRSPTPARTRPTGSW